MNTPAHVVLNALVLGRRRWRPLWLPITAGALAPDLPMFAFYLYQRLALSLPERIIWSHAYFEPRWQAFFDLFNSVPLVALGAVVAWRARSRPWLVFFLSMGLHCLSDLPLHHEDAHAHLYPLSSWRFRSPLSYWDPRHHGWFFAAAEAVLVVAGTLVLARRSRPWRAVGALTLLVYAGVGAFALSFWLG
jgi:hypothetical protein